MIPILAEFGPVKVYSYGVMMASGFWVATYIAAHEYKRRGGNPDHFWRFALTSFVVALVTSHLYWWVREVAMGKAGVRELFSGSGHVWFAGMIGGLLTAWLLIRRLNLNVLEALDSAGMSLPLGHALGRMGCHLAGDGDWGQVTDVPWGVAYPKAIAGWPHPEGVVVHPTPIYEAVAYTATFVLLWRLRKSMVSGALLGLSLLLTSLSRFVIEYWRVTAIVAAGLTEAQWVSIGMNAVAVTLLVRSRKIDLNRDCRLTNTK